jgi:hypothetical protein
MRFVGSLLIIASCLRLYHDNRRRYATLSRPERVLAPHFVSTFSVEVIVLKRSWLLAPAFVPFAGTAFAVFVETTCDVTEKESIN